MANGKVCTGFSKPYVAVYSASGSTVTYTGGMPLARGVSVDIQPTVADDNPFYADNVQAENVAGKFTGGTATLTVDGLNSEAEALILGLPEAETLSYGSNKNASVYNYGDDMEIPYVGVGFLCRYMSAGVESWAPVVLVKGRFSQPNTNAKTQEENIDWQTQTLTLKLSRGDDANHNWKRVGEDLGTEAEAEAVLRAMLNVTETQGT